MIVVFLFLLIFPIPVLASVTLPFSTTYNCTPITQDDVGWPNCDGLSLYGGWHATNGGAEQITNAANYSGGGGGNGQRHWISDGKNFNSGSISVNFASQTEIYVRFYFRHQAGIVMTSDSVPQKLIYFNNAIYCGIGPTTTRITVNGTNFDNGGVWGYNDLMGGSSADGQWHWTEWHLNLNTSTVEAWFDGVKRLNRTDVNYAGATGNFLDFAIPENGQFALTPTTSDFFQDVDDLAVQTTGPIGPLGGGGGGGSSGDSVMMFISQVGVVSASILQWGIIMGYLWERRSQLIKAFIAVTLLRQYYWGWRYRRAVNQWQSRAPFMLEKHEHTTVDLSAKDNVWRLR